MGKVRQIYIGEKRFLMGKNTNQKHNTRTVQALSGKSGKLAAGHIRKRVTESRWIDRESPQSGAPC